MSIFRSSCFKFIYCMQIEISNVKSHLTYVYYTIQNMILINTRARTRKNHEYFYASMMLILLFFLKMYLYNMLIF